MKSILIFVSVIFSTVLFSTNYYVSSSKGNDSNNGTSVSTPFQTIEKINSLTLSPGDSILFSCGNVFRGQLIIKQSGSEGKPIVITKYGSGAPPSIMGSKEITSAWTVYQGNIYKTSCEFRPWFVFENDKWHTIARTVSNETTLFNKLQYLDKEREFYYDSLKKTLYLETWNKSAPAGYIEGSVFDYGVQLISPGQKYITIRGIDFHHQKNAGIFLSENNSNITIDHCNFVNLPEGISCELKNNNSSELQISFNLFRNTFTSAIVPGNCDQAKIFGNDIQGISPLPKMAEWVNNEASIFGTTESAIEISGMNCLLYNNKIDSAGQSGISIIGTRNKVYQNEISNCCLLGSNGGGIYCYLSASTTVSENILHGIKNPVASSSGIFWDNGDNSGSDSIKIIANVIYDCNFGLIEKGFSESGIVSKNLFYNISSDAFLIRIASNNSKIPAHKLKVTGNNFYVLEKNASAIDYFNAGTEIATTDFAACDSNNYYFFANEGSFMINRKMTVADWKKTGNDANGYFFTQSDLQKTSPPNIFPKDQFQLFPNASTEPMSMRVRLGGYKYPDGSEIPESFFIPPWSAVVLRKDSAEKNNTDKAGGGKG